MSKKKHSKKSENGIFLKGTSDYLIWIVVFLLLALGLIMVLSASSATALSESGNSYAYFYRQAKAAGIGFVLMILVSRIDYRIYRRLKWPAYIGIIALLVAVRYVGMSARRSKKMDKNCWN